MGKLTVKQANDLKDSGVITEETLATLQKNGIVSTRTNSSERYISTENGNWVTPIFYFRGLNGNKYSTDMSNLREEMNNLIIRHTVNKEQMININTKTKGNKSK
tara:strand:+ start:119 stop:430 length:312 start_codon:yes stop_codon:yes gene_type:complete